MTCSNARKMSEVKPELLTLCDELSVYECQSCIWKFIGCKKNLFVQYFSIFIGCNSACIVNLTSLHKHKIIVIICRLAQLKKC